MFLSDFGLFARAKLQLARKLTPIKKPRIKLLDKIETGLRKPVRSQILIPPIDAPKITDNFCPSKPAFVLQDVSIDSQEIEDLTKWLEQLISLPIIESFDLTFNMPRRAGKKYTKDVEFRQQEKLFSPEEGAEMCIHGAPKSWCAICIENRKKERKISERRVDPFDLIFPILQPPLSTDFDSPIAFPPGKNLYGFQRKGIVFLIEHERALLADEMGLGKSIQAIFAVRILLQIGKITTCLILCPKSVLTDWEKRFWEWAPEVRVVQVRGSKEQRQLLWTSPAHVYLTTYESYRQDLPWSLKESSNVTIESDGSHTIICPKDGCSARLRITESLFGQEIRCSACHHNFVYSPVNDVARRQFDLVILDEIQKIKNPRADITKAARKIDASRRWGLSGTPLENKLEDLISIFAFLKPGLLHYGDAIRPTYVKKTIEIYFLRRRKADVLPELPEKVYDEAWLSLSPAQQEAYDRAESEGIVVLNEKGDEVTVQHILALITKLKQICNLEPVSQESCKLEHLIEQLELICEQGDKALIFSQYPEKTLKFLEPRLKQFRPRLFHGALSEKERVSIIEEFQNSEDCKVLLVSIKAGGLGVTLTRANYVFHFDLWWNPSVALQAEDRTHRIGQGKTVFVTSLFTKDTIEERIQNLLERKRRLFKEVIDDLSDTSFSKLFTEKELFGLFSLKKAKAASTAADTGKTSASESLAYMSPRQFEELVAALYEKIGYQTKITSQTKDRGVDVYAKRVSEIGIEQLAIQCKHYPNGTVGVEHVRSLYGVIQAQPDITKGILATSGVFSNECKEFAKGKRIELFDGAYLRGLMQKYDILTIKDK